MTDGPDPVEVWQGLRGSRDFMQVVRAGEALCATVEQARAAWRGKSAEHAAAIAELQAEVGALEQVLGQVGDEDEWLIDIVHRWHDDTHWPHGWVACPSELCRAVIAAEPGNTARAEARSALEQAVGA